MTIAPTPVHRHSAPRVGALLAVGAVVLAVAIVLLVRHGGSNVSPSTAGSGVAVAQARRVPSFTGVELAGSNNVTVRAGGKQSVVVRADDNLVRRVTTRVSAGTLVIGNTQGGFRTKAPMSVEITVPSLDTLVLSGSGNVTASGVAAQRLKVTLSGSGTVSARGAASSLDVSHVGSGEVRLGQLAAGDVHAVLSGSGRIVVRATGSFDGALEGTGEIVYYGHPAHVARRVTGVGTISAG